jgi:prolyl oligopeptidase
MPAPARRTDLVETLHGHTVADPYRWMEDLDDPELRTWTNAMAAQAQVALAALPGRGTLRATLAAAMDLARGGAPWRRGGWWFQRRNTGLQDHDVLWCAPTTGGPDGPPTDGWRVLVDPNGWDGARSLGPVAASPDGTLLAIAVSDAGSDWQTWSVLDVASGDALADEVPWSRFSGASWLPDGSGLLTCCYDPPAPGEEHEAAVRDERVVLHRIGGGTETVHARPDAPELGFDATVSHDGAWVVLTLSRGTDPETRVHVAPLAGDGTLGEVVPLLDDGDAAWWPLGVHDGALWCRTDAGAPRGRVVAVPLDGGSHREVLAEQDDQLEVARLLGAAGPGDPGWLVTVHLHHAASRVTVHDLTGRPLHDVPLGGLASCGGAVGGELGGGRRDRMLHLVTTGFDHPARLLRHDPATATTVALTPTLDAHAVENADVTGSSSTAATVDATSATGVLAARVVVERVFVRSGDVDVPVFLVHRDDVVPDGAVPTVLWGYGGFGIAVGPHFRPAWRTWVAHGGLLAVACLRGGSEYGRAWADDGRLGDKQHVFDDALAVAAWLQGEGTAVTDQATRTPVAAPAWTDAAHTGIEGRSNGGLLAAACLTQAPERFGSCVPEVGVLDMLRFHRFTIGWAWTSDYGDPDTPEGFGWVHAYSPLNRLVDGRAYPPTLVTTGDTDDRVVPSHSFKFAAALRHAQGGDAPVQLRVDRAAGHGAGKPVSQLLDERADVLAWHAHHLGLRLVP